MTETAAYSSQAKQKSFKDLDVEKYEIIATLDTSTSEICKEMDGKVFSMKDYQIGITASPFHPNCRTTEAPYFEDDVTSMRAARDENNNSIYVPANMKYQEWYDKFIMKETGKSGIIKIKEKVEKISLNNAKLADIITIGEMIEKEFDIKSSIGNKEKLKEIFSNFREIGGSIPKEVWSKGSSKIVKTQLENAFSYYPKDWGEIPKKSNRQLYVRKVDRGYFAVGAVKKGKYDITLANFKDGFLTIATNGERATTPFHEIGHMVEWFNKDVLRLEKEWIEKRTQGEKEIKLSKLFPFSGYGPREITKKDSFISPYIGKTYSDATEVLSMGLESIFTGTKQLQSFDTEKREYVKKGIEDDEEFLHLIIGLIVKG